MTKPQHKAMRIIRFFGSTAPKVGYILSLLALAFMLCSVVYTGYSVYKWFASHTFRWQSPVLLQTPLIIQPIKEVTIKEFEVIDKVRAEVVKPQAPYTEKQIVLKAKHGPILWKVYQLESQRGKADWCRNNGKGYAGFGVLDRGEIVCYETFEKAVERASYWLDKNWDDESLATTLCRWNLGQTLTTCPYYESYLQVI